MCDAAWIWRISFDLRIKEERFRTPAQLRLENAVRKMTSLPAQIMGITDRGQIHEAFTADVALLDPQRSSLRCVNGMLVINKGTTQARDGAK